MLEDWKKKIWYLLNIHTDENILKKKGKGELK